MPSPSTPRPSRPLRWQADDASRARPCPRSPPGLEGRAQSVHLAHLLVDRARSVARTPPRPRVRRTCTCPDERARGRCKHVAAVAFAVADAIDRDPGALPALARLRAGRAARDADARDPWEAGPLPEPRPARPLPAGAVLKRLGRSGIRVGGIDLADALAPAYEAFAATRDGRRASLVAHARWRYTASRPLDRHPGGKLTPRAPRAGCGTACPRPDLRSPCGAARTRAKRRRRHADRARLRELRRHRLGARVLRPGNEPRGSVPPARRGLGARAFGHSTPPTRTAAAAARPSSASGSRRKAPTCATRS